MSKEVKQENRDLLRAALGVSELKERKKDKLTPEETLQAKLSSLTKESRNRRIIARDGILIYDSKSGSPYINLNSQAQDSKGQKIECRHLSYEVAERQLREYSEKLSSKESIQQQASLKENKYNNDKIKFKSAYYNLFRLNNFGSTLHSIAQILNEGEECSLLLESDSHTMAVSIRHKNNGTYIVKFYDPNATNMHRRALCVNLDAVSQIKIEDFLSGPLLGPYFKNSDSVVISSKLQQKSSRPSLLFIDSSVTVENQIYHFLERGWEGNEKQNFNKVIQSVLDSELDDNKKTELLTAQRRDTKIPGLFAALRAAGGETRGIKIYIEMIANSNKLALTSKMELLSTKLDNWYPGLCMALRDGYAETLRLETIRAYVQAILDSDALPTTNKIELLEARADGIPGLYMALYKGHAEAIRAYIQPILDSDALPTTIKIKLLAAKGTNGIPGIFEALQKGHAEAIKVYVQTILDSRLALAYKRELLNSKSIQESVLHLENNEAVKEYKNGLIKLEQLEDSSKESKSSFFHEKISETEFLKAVATGNKKIVFNYINQFDAEKITEPMMENFKNALRVAKENKRENIIELLENIMGLVPDPTDLNITSEFIDPTHS